MLVLRGKKGCFFLLFFVVVVLCLARVNSFSNVTNEKVLDSVSAENHVFCKKSCEKGIFGTAKKNSYYFENYRISSLLHILKKSHKKN